MEIVELSVVQIIPAEWNPNEMDESLRAKLRRSIERFGLVAPLVVRPIGEGRYETIGGAQRLAVLQELDYTSIPCVVVSADDTAARLLAQALNRLQGADDLGRKAQLFKALLQALPIADVVDVLPETTGTVHALASLGQEEVATQLRQWQAAQAAKLRHFTVQLTTPQLAVVEEALAKVMPAPTAGDDGNPNRRGVALYALCQAYLKHGSSYTPAYRRTRQ